MLSIEEVKQKGADLELPAKHCLKAQQGGRRMTPGFHLLTGQAVGRNEDWWDVFSKRSSN